MEIYEKYLTESSLSRVWKHNEDHDCGTITAFRKARDCGDGERYTKKENMARNKSLLAKLQSKGYGLTKLLGVYPEGDDSESGDVTKENAFFVVDLKDSGKLLADLRKMGEEFEQDSILFIPKGGISNKATAFLIGTNHCSNNWLAYGKKQPFKRGKLGYESEVATSYVNGRPFMFENISVYDIKPPQNGTGLWMMHITAKKHWKELIE